MVLLWNFIAKSRKLRGKYIASVGLNASLNASEFQYTSLNLKYINREKIISLDINNKYKKENNTILIKGISEENNIYLAKIVLA